MTALDERPAAPIQRRDNLREELASLSAELRDGEVDESHVTACMRDYRPGLSAVGLWVLWLNLDDAIQRLECLRMPGGCPCHDYRDRDGQERAAEQQLEFHLDRLTGRAS